MKGSAVGTRHGFLLTYLVFTLIVCTVRAFNLFSLLASLPRLRALVHRDKLFNCDLCVLLFVVTALFLLPKDVLIVTKKVIFNPLLKALLSLVTTALTSSYSFLLTH